MTLAVARRDQGSRNIWPGFVDALATLLLVLIFMLLIFVLAQVYLNEALLGRDQALERLNRQVDELAELLSLERETATVHLDRLEFLRELLPHFPAERIEAAAIEVDRAFSHLARNVNTNLVLAGLWRLLRAPGHPVRDLVAGKDLRDW